MPLMAKEAQQGWRERRNRNEADFPELPGGTDWEKRVNQSREVLARQELIRPGG